MRDKVPLEHVHTVEDVPYKGYKGAPLSFGLLSNELCQPLTLGRILDDRAQPVSPATPDHFASSGIAFLGLSCTPFQILLLGREGGG
jgi:hypothetical protein